MENLNCSECGRLFGQNCEATRAWVEANKELAQSALEYKTETLRSAKEKCHVALGVCKDTGQELRRHMRESHNGIQPSLNFSGTHN